ncbi:glycerophosphoryl diester phosphodiesterase membrane domain-containing protein [Cryobacterium sp. 1639]|uniref:glycerophosphoryl diester phosphodiesterase membrane domain-containing protein n=1 Tax=Cryobacterium inferilacus TaxID=2866629 RepID=UPI001C736D37|nr:glycerophosphoryl diester phosphodiesterase membrane domain-containing protein [Cryobacterium sp. 1639]MBX0300867.1 glycerophosphoryl diester phosphodiesterase membrane domain-containing protein [Cryobacterium sp. 1639]
MTDPNWHPPANDPDRPRYGENLPGAQPGTPPVGPGYGYTPAPPPGWTPPPKPGLIPLRPLGFGSLLGAPFQVLRRNPKATFGSALLVQGVTVLVTLLIVGVVTFFALGRIDAAPVEDQEAVEAGAIVAIVLSALVPIALSIVASALLQGVIVLEVSRATLGEKLRLGALWRQVGRRVWPLVGWTLLLSAALLVGILLVAGVVFACVLLGGAWIGLAVFLGVIGVLALIAAGAWVGTKTAVVPSLIVLERSRIWAAVRRSWSLTGGFFWRTLGVLLLIALIVGVVSQVVTTPLTLLFGAATALIDPNASFEAYIPAGVLYLLTILISLVISAVTAVVQSAAVALIYIDLRMRKEGLDLDLQRFVEAAPGSGAADPYLVAATATGGTKPGADDGPRPDPGAPWA